MKARIQQPASPALSRTTCSAWRVTWDNLSDLARLPGVADLYDTRFFLFVPTTNGEQIAHVGDTLTLHPDGKFSVQNAIGEARADNASQPQNQTP